ncbi:MAG: protein kinase [Acidobacteria bacterium]|nr:protein kinase [Acidobacteriota bacterium]
MGDGLLPPPTLDGRYAIRALIGRGGSSSVYAARDLLLGREVAVKLFTATAADPEELRAEEQEARLVAGLDHRALTTVFDAGVDTSDRLRPRIYLVMERMRGGDLRARLERGALGPEQVACLGADLARGLRHLHDRGLLHRDVKPSNVLLAAERTGGRLHGKLADFGIASPIGAPREDDTMGTAAYISPEQVDGAAASPASDIYALGLVLLEAATGAIEFPGDANASAEARLQRDARIPEHLPAALGAVLRSMLHRAPGDRAGLPSIIGAFDSFLSSDDEENRGFVVPAKQDTLDEPPDEVFDGIADLAIRLLDAPVALVSFVDDTRTRVRSCRGLEMAGKAVHGVDALWTSPDLAAKPWAIADVRSEARLVDSATLAAGPHLRALAAAPLTTHDGRTVGALGVLDQQVRTFSAANLSDLGTLALLLMHDHELRQSIRRALFPASSA